MWMVLVERFVLILVLEILIIDFLVCLCSCFVVFLVDSGLFLMNVIVMIVIMVSGMVRMNVFVMLCLQVFLMIVWIELGSLFIFGMLLEFRCFRVLILLGDVGMKFFRLFFMKLVMLVDSSDFMMVMLMVLVIVWKKLMFDEVVFSCCGVVLFCMMRVRFCMIMLSFVLRMNMQIVISGKGVLQCSVVIRFMLIVVRIELVIIQFFYLLKWLMSWLMMIDVFI